MGLSLWMATLWGIPASLLVKTIWKGVSAGTSQAVRVVGDPRRGDRELHRAAAPPPDGAAEGAPEGAGSGGCLACAGAGDATPPPPDVAPRGGMTPPAISSDPTKSTAKTMSVPVGEARRRDVLEVPGDVGLLDLAVLLARVDQPAEKADDRHEEAGDEDHRVDDEAEQQGRRGDRREQRPERGAGDVDAGRGPRRRRPRAARPAARGRRTRGWPRGPSRGAPRSSPPARP